MTKDDTYNVNNDKLLSNDTESIKLPSIYKIDHEHQEAKTYLTNHLLSVLQQFNINNKIIVLCIGTDRSTGDALGPLVGTMLSSKHDPKKLTVIGTLDKPVHALNLERTLVKIKREHADSLVLAVDACLGTLNTVGQIQIGLGSLKPGTGVNKKLPSVGQLYITGVVNIAGFLEYFVLQNTRLSMIVNMAELISASLLSTSESLSIPDKTLSV